MRSFALALPFVALLLLGLSGVAHAAEAVPASSESAAWTDPATGMTFARIPAGCFRMGSPLNESGHQPDEATRQVCVKTFWMGRYEVTRAQFAAFVAATGYETSAERQGWIRVWNKRWENVYLENWREPGMEQGDDEPVLAVSWEDARAMAAWMSAKGHGRFRLPTEAEWEYAARAGTATARYWGDAYDERVCEYANVGDLTNLQSLENKGAFENALREREPTPATPCKDGYVFASPVGSFKPNAFGLYDMLGNAQEWCSDAHPDDPALGHMVRGGSFLSITKDVRAAKREWVSHEYGVYFTLGFRLVREP